MDLGAYYHLLFGLAQHHKYSIHDYESMYPFERDIIFNMLQDYLKEQAEKHAQMQG